MEELGCYLNTNDVLILEIMQVNISCMRVLPERSSAWFLLTSQSLLFVQETSIY